MARHTISGMKKGRISVYLNYSILSLDLIAVLFFTVGKASPNLLDNLFSFVLLKSASYIAVFALLFVMVERVTCKITNEIFVIRIVSTVFLLLLMTLAFGVAKTITQILGIGYTI